MVLEADDASRWLAKVRHFGELALGHTLVPVFAVLHVFIVKLAVHPGRALLRRDQDSELVPLAGGLGGVSVRLIELIEPAGLLRIAAAGVLNLDFGAGVPGGIAGLLDM